jgi:hypothetical protein
MTAQKPPSQEGCECVGDCIEICDAALVFVEENGVRATFANHQHRQIRKIEYDDCYCKPEHGLQADYIVGLFEIIDIITELKGSDLKHARSQVEATLERWREEGIRYPKIACLIVYGRLEGPQRRAGRIPKMRSTVQTLELDFFRQHRTILVVRESSAHQFRVNDFV